MRIPFSKGEGRSGNPPRHGFAREKRREGARSGSASQENRFPFGGLRDGADRHPLSGAKPEQQDPCPARGFPQAEAIRALLLEDPRTPVKWTAYAGRRDRPVPTERLWSNDGSRTRYTSIRSRLLYLLSYICVLREGSNLRSQDLILLLYPTELQSRPSPGFRPWHTGLAVPPAPGEGSTLPARIRSVVIDEAGFRRFR